MRRACRCGICDGNLGGPRGLRLSMGSVEKVHALVTEILWIVGRNWSGALLTPEALRSVWPLCVDALSAFEVMTSFKWLPFAPFVALFLRPRAPVACCAWSFSLRAAGSSCWRFGGMVKQNEMQNAVKKRSARPRKRV